MMIEFIWGLHCWLDKKKQFIYVTPQNCNEHFYFTIIIIIIIIIIFCLFIFLHFTDKTD